MQCGLSPLHFLQPRLQQLLRFLLFRLLVCPRLLLLLLFLLLPILTLKAVCLFLLTEGRKATGQRDAAAARAAGRNAKRGGGLPTGGAESGAVGLCGGEDLGAALEEYLGRALLLAGCVLSLLRADASCALGRC